MELQIGQRLTVIIEKLSLGGDGLARLPSSDKKRPSAFVIFVPYGAPGDRVEIKITEKKKNFARGRIVQILHKGSGRTLPPCPYFFNPSRRDGFWCGGCNFQQLGYESQLKEKSHMLKESLGKTAGVSPDRILPMIGSSQEEEWRYRNKIQIPFGRNGDHKEVIAGFFAPNSHRIVPIEDCLIHSEEMLEFAKFVCQTMDEWKLDPYSEKRHCGWLRHLLIRREETSKKMVVTFVTLTDFFPHRKRWQHLIQKRFPNVAGACQNVNEQFTNVILGRKWKKLFGHDFLIEKLHGLKSDGSDLKLRVSAGSFFQVNTKMAEKLYRVAKELVLEKSASRKILLDLYCGVGGIGLACASHFEKVVGIDESHSSIRDAHENKRINQIHNCEFYSRDAESFLMNFYLADLDLKFKNQQSNPIALVVDPPRAGCSNEALKIIAKIHFNKIVYISCEPSTLARDLKFLNENGYEVRKVQPVDLFPQSAHIESVSLLERKILCA